MKKILPILLCVCVIASVFVACSSGKKDDATTAQSTSSNIITTDKAKITEADAVNYIQSYDKKELGLTADEMKNCKFMVANSGEKIEKDYYIKVIATVATEHKDKETGKSTFTFDNKGEYFIRYDGKQVLTRDVKTGKYSEMKVKKYETTAPATAKNTTLKAQTTKKK